MFQVIEFEFCLLQVLCPIAEPAEKTHIPGCSGAVGLAVGDPAYKDR